MKRTRTMLLEAGFLASLALAFCAFAGNAAAATCEPEPTDMSVGYGEQITCGINPSNDTDIFRFSGNAGDRILAEALWVSGTGFAPRIQLIAPDGTDQISNAGLIDITFVQTGAYTAIISDVGSNNVGEYAFTVSCTAGSCFQPPGLPTLTLSLTGCTICQAGDPLTVQAHLTNPGSSTVSVEAKMGLRLPDGTTINLLGNRHLELALPAGFDLPFTLPDHFPIPGGWPAGTWSVEATLLGPDLGETFSREVKPFEVLP